MNVLVNIITVAVVFVGIVNMIEFFELYRDFKKIEGDKSKVKEHLHLLAQLEIMQRRAFWSGLALVVVILVKVI